MGEARKRKVDGKYISFKGDDFRYKQDRIIKRMENFIRKQRGKK